MTKSTLVELDQAAAPLAGGMFTPEQLAEKLGTNRNTLAQWRYRGTGPRYMKRNGLLWYLREDVEAWLREGRRESTRPTG